jgi:hypothetical protein
MKPVIIRILSIVLLIIALFINNSTYSQSSYKVSGNVFLEDNLPTGSHAGVSVKFYTLPGKIFKDSTTSLTDGSYSKLIAPGYYLVEWTKPGYVFEEFGGLALAKDTNLADVTLIPGEIQYVSGDVSGTWTRNFVYIVTSDIRIPIGFTLTINPGVRVKFSKNTGMTCNGRLIAEGTPTQRIKFTSKEPSPLPGDWNSIILYAGNNNLKYIDYDYATQGISGNSINYSNFENIKMWGTLSNSSIGGLYFGNSNYLIIKDCEILTKGNYGIITGGEGCTITNNKIYGPYSSAAISTDGRRSTRIDSNVIGGNPIIGIQIGKMDAVDTTYIRFNTINGATTGISAQGSQYNISSNVITGFVTNGITENMGAVTNSIIDGNRLTSDFMLPGGKVGIYGHGKISNNSIVLKSNSRENFQRGIISGSSIIENNTVIVENAGNYMCYGIISEGESSTKNNFIKINVFDYYPANEVNASFAIKSISGGPSNNTIQGNTIELQNQAHGIMSWYTSVSNNSITGIGAKESLKGTAFSTLYAKNLIFENVVSNVYNGFYNSSSGYEVKIESNTVNCLGTILFSNQSKLTVSKNLFTTESDNGIKLDNQTNGEFVNNTIIRRNEPPTPGGDYGFYLTNTSTPVVKNNLIQGFSQGIYSDNSLQNFNILHNNWWRIKGAKFSGSAMPPLIGELVDQNANGDSSDIYKNVVLDPGFVDPDSNYHLSGSSKMINAGDPTIIDPDNTISDIGAYSHYIWVSVAHQAIGNTANTSTPYQIDAEVYSPVSNPVTAKLYYKLNGGSFTELAMTNSSGSIFGAQIPAQPLGTLVEYYIEGTDGTNITRSPGLAPTQLHSFNVTLIQQYSRLSGNSNISGKIVLNWDDPQLTSGTISNLGVYRSTTPNVSQSNLLTSLSDTANTFVDENVSEGDVFYYRIGATITHTGGSTFLFVSDEKSVMSDAVGYVLVKGKVSLKDTSNFAGIMIEFERTSPSPIKRDTVYADANGNYKYIPTAGIYNINVKKAGWLPLTIPEKILTENTILDSVSLRRGSVVSISGNVSGRWLNAFAYNVTGNLTVNAGDTLFIEKGTLVKFTDNFNLTVNGVLIADGDSLEKIEFTSGKTVNRAGDWGSITLNAPGSVIRYANYKYATEGITGNNAARTIIEHCTFSNMPTAANGVVFSSSRDLRINHNDFQLIQGNGIYAPYSRGSQFNSNSINSSTTFASIFTEGADSSQINHNNIVGRPETGIFGDHMINSEITGNSLIVKTQGIYARYGSHINITENLIKEYLSRGIDLYATKDSYIYKNQLEAGYYGISYAIFGYDNYRTRNLIIRKNDITTNIQYFDLLIYVNNSIIDSNNILLNCDYFNQVINAPSSLVKHNNININLRYGGWEEIAINTSAGGPSTIESNTIICNRSLNAIKAANSEIRFNDIKIGGGEKWAMELKGNSTFSFNRLSIVRNAILSTSGVDNSIINNDIFLSAGGRGMELQNSAVREVTNNTLIANNGETGLFVSSLTNPSIVGNHIQGFSTGLQAESQITNISFNNFYNNTTKFSGAGLPPVLGQISTVNANGTPSDVYNNIFVDPLFVNLGDSTGGDFHLTSNSPLINAGNPERMDPDGTVSDIGAYFYNFGFVPKNLKADSTGNSKVYLSWTVEPTDTLTGFKAFYKIEGATSWMVTDQFTGASVLIEGLTNNVNYIFAVKAVYGNTESNLSESITTKPGVAAFSTSRYVVAIQELNNNVQKTAEFLNHGNRDVNFSFKTPFDNPYISVSDTTGMIIPEGNRNVQINFNGSSDGVRYDNLLIQNNGNNEPEFKVNALQIVGLGHLSNLTPVKFTPVPATQKVFYLVVNSAYIDGMNLSTGDEIAIYSGNLCVGAAKFTGQFPMILKGYGVDGGSGFVEGDSMVIKTWQLSTNRYSFLNTTLLKGSDHLFDGAFAAVDLFGSIYSNEKILLTKNKFNLISSFLLPRDVAATSFFGNIPSLKIAYEDNGSAFIPQYNINTIGNIDITEGYHVFVTDSVLLNVEGVEIESTNYPLFIEKNRFNSIAFLYGTPMAVEYAFASIYNRVKIVQDDKGGVWIPSLNLNTIGNLLPGSGYQMYSDSSVSFSFRYPAIPAFLAKNQPKHIQKQPVHFMVETTGLPYVITIGSLNLGKTMPAEGDEIAVYDGGVCVGATVWQPDVQNHVIAWGGNEDAGLPGFKAGNKISFKLFSKETDSEHELIPAFGSKSEEVFMGSAFSSVKLSSESALIPDRFLLYNNYPNPFNPSTTLRFDLPENSKVSLVVYNLLGESIRTIVNNIDYKPGRFSVEWDGRDNSGFTVPSGVYLIRFETEKYREVKKAILLK